LNRVYRILRRILLLEAIAIFILDKYFKPEFSLPVRMVGALICALPLQVLLFLLSKDNTISRNKRMLCTCIFWHINFCYAVGVILAIAGFPL